MCWARDPWARFSQRQPTTGGSKTTKPHHAHPNHVFYIGDEPWATRFEQRDAISRSIRRGASTSVWTAARRPGPRRPRLFHDRNGQVAIADTTSPRVIEVIDLTRAHPSDMLLGWARGLLVEGNNMWVASRASGRRNSARTWAGCCHGLKPTSVRMSVVTTCAPAGRSVSSWWSPMACPRFFGIYGADKFGAPNSV
jgi:hypothetical protein